MVHSFPTRRSSDLLTIARHQPRDRARLVVVEGADCRDIVRVNEDQAPERPEKGREDEERQEARTTGESDDDPGAWANRRTA